MGIVRCDPHKLPLRLLVSSEPLPAGRRSAKLEIGTSGSVSNDELRIPVAAMWVWPTSTTVTPSPLRITSRSG